jgi:hypothetical protein
MGAEYQDCVYFSGTDQTNSSHPENSPDIPAAIDRLAAALKE